MISLLCVFLDRFVIYSCELTITTTNNNYEELARISLERTVLSLKSLGADPMRAGLPTPLPTEHLQVAMETLYALGAIDDQGALTTLGFHAAALPLHPSNSYFFSSQKKMRLLKK